MGEGATRKYLAVAEAQTFEVKIHVTFKRPEFKRQLHYSEAVRLDNLLNLSEPLFLVCRIEIVMALSPMAVVRVK